MPFARLSSRFLTVLLLSPILAPFAVAGEPPQPAPVAGEPPKVAEEVAEQVAEEPAEPPADPVDAQWPKELGDPRSGEVPLPAAKDWRAYLVLDNRGVGVWTVKSFPVFPRLACPEVVGLDDHGRCLVLTNYSGKWAALETIRDGAWLGGLEHGDLDPRIPGAEVYTGSRLGNLYQVIAHPEGFLDNRRIAHFEGRAVNTLVAGELDGRPGKELLVFTWPGGLWRVDPTGPHGTWLTTRLGDVEGRIRDAVVLPGTGRPKDVAKEIATVSRNGRLRILTLTAEGPVWTTVYEASMGMGRIALRPGSTRLLTVLYSTHDDGRILRHVRPASGTWVTETIYLGPQGPRGIAAGRFFADPEVESVAIYGYSGRVEILSRKGDGAWQAETILKDPDKGHWVAVCEVDGRNATQELVASGFAGRIVLLSRPAGYGRSELTTSED